MNAAFVSLFASARAITPALVLAVFAQASVASAADLSYSLTGGTLTGTLNGTGFTNASYTISATADPANIQTGSINASEVHYLALTTTLLIDGFAPVTFTNPNFGIFSILGDPIVTSSAGFAAYPDPTGFRILGGYVSLLVPDSLSGSLRQYVEVPFPTSGGDLVIAESGYGGSPTFTVAAVPEPHAILLGVFGALALVSSAWSRNRIRTA